MTDTIVASEIGELFALRPGVYSVTGEDGQLSLLAWPHAERLGRLDADQQAVLRALAGRRACADELVALAGGAPGVRELLARLRQGGWLTTTVTSRGRDLYTLSPLREAPPVPGALPHPLVLSRFALIRRHGSDMTAMTVESPRAWCDVRVHDAEVLAVLGGLAGPDPATHQRILRDLYWAGVLVEAGGAEETELELRQWSPHELWFHDRSRLGYRGYFGDRFGRTFWARGTFDPLPAEPEPFPGATVALPRPDLPSLRRTDPTLTTVLEDRESVREHDDDNPISVDQLGEFLYRCARTRMVRHGDDGIEYANRPHPSGGSVYELELYPVVRLADGLDPGMYHYDSHAHRLETVCDASSPALRRLLRVATHSTVAARPPQVLIVVSARIGRLMWKYEAMPYALALKHVGVLYQTMYCVATAMGLAPCGLGSGDSRAFTEATGRNPYAECSVGEFMLGSRRPQPQIWELGR
ncbi:MAG: SagB family peptide dehydrogenase [Pseudonocardiaceae bacterium]